MLGTSVEPEIGEPCSSEHEAQNNNPLLGENKTKLCLHVVHDFTGFMKESIKEIMKEIMDNF